MFSASLTLVFACMPEGMFCAPARENVLQPTFYNAGFPQSLFIHAWWECEEARRPYRYMFVIAKCRYSCSSLASDRGLVFSTQNISSQQFVS
jgi:hypothetical protein